MSVSSPRRPDQNPFRSEVIDRIRFRPQGCTWDQLLERLETFRWRAVIVGREGTGKTALLRELAERSSRRALTIELHGDEANPLSAALSRLATTPGPDDAVFFDGAEQLNPVAWWGFNRRVRATGGLVITSHRPGRLPTLIETTASPALLRNLVEELVPEDIEELAPQLAGVFARHEGNIRSCFRELYDVCAGRSS